MNSKKLIAILSVLVLTLVLGLTMFSGNKTRAAVGCAVPSGTYPTIQSAASDPGCTTITVAPGTYNENVVITNASTINGAQAGNNNFIARNGNPAGESTVNGVALSGNVAVFTISAANVTINGLTVKNSVTSGAAMGITVAGGGNGAAILNNIIDTITTPDTGGNGTAQAVYFTSGGADGVNVENNEIKNVHSNRSAKGVLIGDNGGTNPSQNVQVKGNSIHDVISDTRGAYGVSVANVLNVSGLMVLNNTFNNLTGGAWVHAIGLEGDTPGVIVAGNTVTNITAPGADRLAVWFESNPSFSSGQVNNNNLDVTALSFGMAVQPTLIGANVDGKCNWWGDPSGPSGAGPGTGSQVSPKVTFAPWLISPAPGAACIGGNVPTNKDQCKSDGWKTRVRADGSTFKNQGDCIQYANTGK